MKLLMTLLSCLTLMMACGDDSSSNGGSSNNSGNNGGSTSTGPTCVSVCENFKAKALECAGDAAETDGDCEMGCMSKGPSQEEIEMANSCVTGTCEDFFMCLLANTEVVEE